MLAALLLAIPLRKNMPVALIVTLYTNPLTIVPLYVLAYGYGRCCCPASTAPLVAPFETDWGNFPTRCARSANGCSRSASRSRSAWSRSA